MLLEDTGCCIQNSHILWNMVTKIVPREMISFPLETYRDICVNECSWVNINQGGGKYEVSPFPWRNKQEKQIDIWVIPSNALVHSQKLWKYEIYIYYAFRLYTGIQMFSVFIATWSIYILDWWCRLLMYEKLTFLRSFKTDKQRETCCYTATDM